MGRGDEAAAAYRRAREESAAASGNRPAEVVALTNLGGALLNAGRAAEAEAVLGEAVGIADALREFDRLGPRRREEIALEIALLSEGGLDIIDPAPKYALRTLPGRYCGLHLLAIMYAAFRQIDATIDTGADFLREYEMAQAMGK